MDENSLDITMTIYIVSKNHKAEVGVAIRTPKSRSGMLDRIAWDISLYQFFEDESSLSHLDSLLISSGANRVYFISTKSDLDKGEFSNSEKLKELCDEKNIEITILSSGTTIRSDIQNDIEKLMIGFNDDTNNTNYDNLSINNLSSSSTVTPSELITLLPKDEFNLAYIALGCLINQLSIMEITEYYGKYQFTRGNLYRFMRLDSTAIEAINLLPSNNPTKKISASDPLHRFLHDDPTMNDNLIYSSVYEILNNCQTKMGSRLLQQWLRQPLLDKNLINERLNMVQYFLDNNLIRSKISGYDGKLRRFPDLDNIRSKLMKKKGSLIDLYKLFEFTGLLVDLIEIFEEDLDMEEMKIKFLNPLKSISNDFSTYQQFIRHIIDFSQLPDLFINPEHDNELRELRNELDELKEQINHCHKVISKKFNHIGDVKLDDDKIRGYIFRIPSIKAEKELSKYKKELDIIMIKKNGVYFTNSILKETSKEYKNCYQRYEEKQKLLVGKAIETAATYLPVIEASSNILSEIDVLISFAEVAVISDYVRPNIYDMPNNNNENENKNNEDNNNNINKGFINLDEARHPCVERQSNVTFIPNNYHLRKGESSFQIVTGPNMGGKSTYIRGIGAIIVMAQVGSFVPCKNASFTIVDSILARVGAGDVQNKGISTFMAEMLEASTLLKVATSNSLLIIDELGRGTSTFDGFGLAWAISQYICEKIDCFTLFATHFHELTALDQIEPAVNNLHVTAFHSAKEELKMLYEIKKGPCLESFGIHVAEIADFPPSVILIAKKKAIELENFSSLSTTSIIKSNLNNKNNNENNNENNNLKKDPELTKLFINIDIENLSPDETLESINKLLQI